MAEPQTTQDLLTFENLVRTLRAHPEETPAYGLDALARIRSQIDALLPPTPIQGEQEKLQLLGENQRQKALLEAIFEADPGGLAVLVGPELRFAFTNPAYRFICPDPVIDPVGRPYDEVWPARSRYRNREHFRTVLATGRPYQVSGVRHCFPDRTERVFTVQARRIEWDEQKAVLVLMWDITEQFLAQQRAERERSHLQAVLEALPVGVAILNENGGQIQANAMFNQIWQGPLPPTHGVADYVAYQAWWPDTGKSVQPQEWASARAVQKGEAVLGQEIKIRRFDGSEAFVLNSGVPIRDARGGITGSVVAIEDITRRHETEMALVVSNERLAALMEAATRLLAGSDPIARLNEFFDNFSSRLGLEIYVQYNLATDGRHLELGSWAGFPEKDKRILARLELGEAVCGTVAQIRQPIIVTDVQQSTDRKTELIRKLGVGTYACHPLMVGERLLGTLSFGSKRLNRFEPETIELLRTFCNLVALAIDRQRTEHALRDALETAARSEVRFRSLFERMVEGFALHEIACDEHGAPCDYRFLEINPAFERLTGLKREMVIGKWKSEIPQLAGDDPNWIDIYGKVALTGESVHFENYSLALKQHYEVFSYRPAPNQFAVLFIDSTERKLAEEKLVFQAGLLAKVHDAVVAVDADWLVTYWNPAAAEMFGWSEAEVMGRNVRQIFQTDFLTMTPDQAVQELIDNGIFYHDVRYRRKDGTSFAANTHTTVLRDALGAIKGYFTTVRDISEKKVAAATLAASEARFRDLLESIQDGFMQLDRDWRFTYTNRRAASNVGLEPEAAIGKNIWEMFPEIRGTPHERYYRQVMETRQPAQFKISGILTPKNYDIRVYPSVEGISVFWVDVTERRRIESEAASQAVHIELQHRLLEQRELERQQIARDLHDGPLQELTGVILKLEDLLGIECPPDMKRQIADVQDTVREQISELRVYAGDLRPPALARFGLGKAIRSHMDAFQEKHPELRLRLDDGLGEDPLPEEKRLAFYRIYQESLTNTVKHARAKEIQVHLWRDAGEIALEICDDGAGFEIPHDWLELARKRHLGLVGMRERAEAAGGTLQIDSQPGTGTCITVRVPM
jgi:PAS domain S-box-containing protein